MARTRPEVIPPPLGPGAIEGANRYSRSQYLTREDIAHGTRQLVPTIPVLVEGDDIDWSLLDRPAVTRVDRQTRLDEAVATAGEVARSKIGSIVDGATIDALVREIVQALAYERRIV